MTTISDIKVYDLKESVIACRNAMRLEPAENTEEEFQASLPRAMALAMCGGGSGHSNFRCGIRVSFNIKYPNYLSPELQRYHFLDIVTSSSKMHRLVKMDMDACFNKYVCIGAKEMMKELLAQYNELAQAVLPEDDEEFYKAHKQKVYEAFMRVLSNCPLGIELFMRVSTNYEQLATIYRQRRKHRLLEDWGAICDMIESLPYAHELIICDDKDK